MPSRLLRSILALTLAAFALVASNMPSALWAQPKAKIAIFPLGGDANEDLRSQVAFSLRAKLDREGSYEVIDGYTMADAVNGRAVTLETDLTQVQAIARPLDAEILIWGSLIDTPQGRTLKLKMFEAHQLDPQPHEVTHQIAKATDLRFVSEAVVEKLAGVHKHEHPSEVAVQQDATAEALWKANPNLLINGSFEEDGKWDFIYLSQKAPIKMQERPPIPDEAVINKLEGNRVLAMRMSRTAAESNGLAVLSASIPVEPATRYRLSFRYQSDGPKLRVFVKGYTLAENIKGEKTEREIYRRQVPPTAGTDGQWVTITDELNPQQVAMPVQYLKVDLYVYLHPGLVLFDDVSLKAVGKQTRDAKDAAIDLPVTRPSR